MVFGETEITDLGELEEIWGKADFRDSKIKELGKIKRIRGVHFGVKSNCQKKTSIDYLLEKVRNK